MTFPHKKIPGFTAVSHQRPHPNMAAALKKLLFFLEIGPQKQFIGLILSYSVHSKVSRT
jgi:hypothetical protein